MSADNVEVEYEFHNNTAFVQVEFGLEDEDVEETEGLTQKKAHHTSFELTEHVDR